MTGAKIAVLLVLATLATSCGSSSLDNNPPYVLPDTSLPFTQASGPNVLAVNVGGTALCSKGSYINEPCVTIQVCMPGTSQCQTVTDVLVDSGSVGLRVFPGVLGFTPTPSTDSSGNTIAECAQFGIGSDWGPLAQADVILGGEPPVTVPIQLINKGFATAPSPCSNADTDPASAGFNGILGVGPFTEDCGAACAASAASRSFYSCDSSGKCTAVALPRAQQPQNIVSNLPVDNNGVIFAIGQVPLGGVPAVSGNLILGIGTASNNVPASPSSIALDQMGNFTTSFQGQNYPGSFVDSGSNGTFFPNTVGLQLCPSSGPAAGFYCPDSTQTFSGTNAPSSGGSGIQTGFAVGNAESLSQSPNTAFVDIAGNATNSFDWGLPFFFGRAVYIGYQGKSSSLGAGPVLGY